MVINSLTAQPFMVVSSINGVKFTQVLTIKINVKKLIPFAFSTNNLFQKLLIRFWLSNIYLQKNGVTKKPPEDGKTKLNQKNHTYRRLSKPFSEKNPKKCNV